MFGDLLDPVHLILLLVVALLVFGPKRLPEVGKGLGETLREFRKAMHAEDTPGSPSALDAKAPDGAPIMASTPSQTNAPAHLPPDQ
jgi:sec-independent protein translocase protein TatA